LQQNVKFNDKLSPEKELAVCRAMMELSGDIAFEWDVDSDVISLSDKWEARFATPSLRRDFGPYIESGTSVIHQEDLASMISEINSMRNGAAYGESVVRIIDKNGSYTWNRVRAASECDESGRLVRIIGTIADIDSDKRRSQALLVKAEQDSLTGLLNKDTARFRAEQYLANMGENQRAAMLVIDLDNFKAVNDQYGHLFGDDVLIRVANILKHSFRNDDIVGRIGGEEFLVLMKNVGDPRKVVERCSHLLESIRASSTTCKLTASIGVGIVSGTATRYEDLFLRTDEALYQAKNAGKNQYILCK
jgi:putative two-component system response regulator